MPADEVQVGREMTGTRKVVEALGMDLGFDLKLNGVVL